MPAVFYSINYFLISVKINSLKEYPNHQANKKENNLLMSLSFKVIFYLFSCKNTVIPICHEDIL